MATNTGGAARPILVSAAVLVCIPSAAHANAGTLLMWAGALHLLFGNAIIGALEGLILSRILRSHPGKTTLLMIVANYASAWAGYILLAGFHPKAQLTIDNVWRYYWLMVLAAYALTLLIEWPFAAVCARRTPNWLGRSVSGTLIVQTLSYAVLFGYYWSASDASLCTGITRVPLAELSVPEGTVLYYIDDQDGSARSMPLAGGTAQTIHDLRSTNDEDRLFIRSTLMPARTWDLCARLENENPNEPTIIVLRQDLTGPAAVDHFVGQSDDPRSTWMNFRRTAQLGAAADSPWAFCAGFWPVEGLRGTNDRTGEQVDFALETPFVAWAIRNVTHLPNDLVVFQLGDDQICLADPISRRMALVARGRGPAVAIERPPAPTPAASQTTARPGQ